MRRKNWWAGLLYINNFEPSNYDDQCMPWTWYLANDMQMFFIGAALLTIYLRSRKLAAWVAVALIAVCITLNAIIASDGNFYRGEGDAQNQYDFFKIVFFLIIIINNFIVTFLSSNLTAPAARSLGRSQPVHQAVHAHGAVPGRLPARVRHERRRAARVRVGPVETV